MKPLLSSKQKAIYLLSCIPVSIVTILYVLWWFRPEHFVFLPFTVLTSWIVLYDVLSPFWFYYFAGRSVHWDPVPAGECPVRVAIVVTKAPSEPEEVVQNTLLGCLNQTVLGCDVWLVDEKPESNMLRWCKANGVRVCSRYNHPDYHSSSWPRRTRCKEGNLSYFYDKIGYKRYDIVAQFDADHCPEPNYMSYILSPFLYDGKIGYVAAPSVCSEPAHGQNKLSWAARGRLFLEATMHGPLQAGYANGWAPLCIGSHYAVRTRALKDIGGLGPELAEDHSTSLFMQASGWKGAFQINARAYGQGPRDLESAMTQEYQWSKSVTTILLQFTMGKFKTLPLNKKIEFLYSELWYLCFSSVSVIGYSLLILTLAFDIPLVRMNYFVFLFYAVLTGGLAILPVRHLKSIGLLRPNNIPLLSWEGPLFEVARFPWSTAGIVAGVWSCLSGHTVNFKVTPKGVSGAGKTPLKLVSPSLLMGLGVCIAVVFTPHAFYTRAYHALGLFGVGILLLSCTFQVVLGDIKNSVPAAIATLVLWLIFLPTSYIRLPGGVSGLIESQQHGYKLTPGDHGLHTRTE